MSIRGQFIAWYNNEFKADPLYAAMLETVEASPWHRERNVGIHSDMVVSEYISWADKSWDHATLLGAIACAFHDTGKPSARVVKFKPERGNYNSFGGHEIISARLWEDYAMRNFETFGRSFKLTLDDIYKIGFIIEHHMPYQVGDDKVKDIAVTSLMLSIGPAFVNHLTADTHGRVADDHADKIAGVDAWIAKFIPLAVPLQAPCQGSMDTKHLFIPIAASGSGKSTFAKNLSQQHSFAHYSWDDLRLQLYDPTDYKRAYQMSVDDTQFNNKVMKAFNDLVKTGQNIYVDNTNLSRKRRAPFITAARKAGYTVYGYVFPIALQTVIARQQTRGDKCVPDAAVKQHYMSLQCPLYGEFDVIEVIDSNS